MRKKTLTIDLTVDTTTGAAKLYVDRVREQAPWYKRLLRKPILPSRVGYGVVIPLRLHKKTQFDISQPELLRMLQHTRKLEIRADNPEEIRV